MSTIDLEAIRRRLESSSLAPSPAAAAPPAEKPEGRGPLGSMAWPDECRVGPRGAAEDAGRWMQEHWTSVAEASPDVGGLLGGPGLEAKGGPPDRLTKLQQLEEASGRDLDCPRESALLCVFAMMFWAHQQAISFKPNLSMSAAGQKDSSSSEDLFQTILKALNLAQQICRDIRNLAYSRYGCEQAGLKEVSRHSRESAEAIRKHCAGLKVYVNNVMADSIGLSTGGA